MNSLSIPPWGTNCVNVRDTERLITAAKRERAEHLGSRGLGRALVSHPAPYFLPWGAELLLKTEVGIESSRLAERQYDI